MNNLFAKPAAGVGGGSIGQPFAAAKFPTSAPAPGGGGSFFKTASAAPTVPPAPGGSFFIKPPAAPPTGAADAAKAPAPSAVLLPSQGGVKTIEPAKQVPGALFKPATATATTLVASQNRSGVNPKILRNIIADVEEKFNNDFNDWNQQVKNLRSLEALDYTFNEEAEDIFFKLFQAKNHLHEVTENISRIEAIQTGIEDEANKLEIEISRSFSPQKNGHREDLYDSIVRLAQQCQDMDKDLQDIEKKAIMQNQSLVTANVDEHVTVDAIIQIINVQDTNLQAMYMTAEELRRYIEEIQHKLRDK